MELAIYVPIITALVQLLRQVFLPSRFASLAAVVLGVGYALLANGIDPESILFGVVLGLSASGLYDVARHPVTDVVRRIR